MNNSNKEILSKICNKFTNSNHTGDSEPMQNQANTVENLNTQISDKSLELQRKHFTLALLINQVTTYEKLIKSFEDEKKVKTQLLRTLQQQVFENRIHFSNELNTFALNDTSVCSINNVPGPSKKPVFAGVDSKAKKLTQITGVEWKINQSEYTFLDEDDKFLEEIQLDDETVHGRRKTKFVFKEPTVSK